MTPLLQLAVALLILSPYTIMALYTSGTTVTDLQSIATASTRKIPGSMKYLGVWRLWSHTCVQLIRSDLKRSLPTPADYSALQTLEYQLGRAADVGYMPSFEHEGARAGYALNYFCRAHLLADLLFGTVKSIEAFVVSEKECRLGSLGGGPGFDFVALALLATYKAQQRNQRPTAIHATVFEYEEGWGSLVEVMASSTSAVLGGAHTCGFGACDITLPLSHPANAQCAAEAGRTDVWVCSYCVAENAQRLREGGYIFFRELFARAKMGALVVFTETTHRIWPELMDAVSETGFDVSFPQAPKGRGKGGRQMVLQKRVGATIGQEEKELCKLFLRDSEMHERKIQNGHVREARKVRGAKY